eukprot:gene4870-9702_t
MSLNPKIILVLLVYCCHFTYSNQVFTHFNINNAGRLEQHEEGINDLIKNLKHRKAGQQVTIRRKTSESHCPRPQAYKDKSLQVDISKMNNIISILKIKPGDIPDYLQPKFSGDFVAIIDVQAMTNMEQLVDQLLPLGIIPAVVPEFKGITVGGSIQGLAAESSSFKYGFFHDVVIGFEAILGDGRVVWCSKYSNKDLFYGIPGSFGTLGIVTRAKMLCIRAQPYLELDCKHHYNAKDCIESMGRIQDSFLTNNYSPSKNNNNNNTNINSIEMLEGIGYSNHSFVSMCGRFISKDEVDKVYHNRKYRIGRCNKWGHKWFFNQIRDLLPKHRWFSSKKPTTSTCTSSSIEYKDKDMKIVFPTKDYLFRHDRGSFWMASYNIPQFIGRFMGSVLDSTNMFRLATLIPWAFPKKMIMLQDFMLPRTTVLFFLSTLQELLCLWPVWLLPVRNIPSPKSLFVLTGVQGHMCNVGAYGIPRKRYEFITANKQLEDELYERNGRKVYYSHAFYSKEFFYKTLYDGRRYDQLRQLYGASEAFPDLHSKVITKDGKL